MTTAKDIMQTEVVTVGLDGSLSSVYRLFAAAEIEVMTSGVVALAPDTRVSEIIKTVVRDRIQRVLVVECRRGKEALVGLISLLDLVAAFASDECDG